MDYKKERYKKISNAKFKEKPFGIGMYAFVMFLINYYSRIKKELGLDYDSFMIVQVVVSHSLYQINKASTFCRICSDGASCTHANRRFSFTDLGYGWDNIIEKNSNEFFDVNANNILHKRYMEKNAKLSKIFL